ncbi:hypothetical protein Nepgr_008384 [Nepenthes gracilis]|uniref:Chalcone-flavanone isomerase family protein n=1 Tax=Nepenthes gracilis TaxID=150966 RepID=A0AAD3S8X0_NEPGR|nr:hypothetical protein Nepgr_008384 [Nepenthes gracilis]
METPSTSIVIRSQTPASLSNSANDTNAAPIPRKGEDFEKDLSKSRKKSTVQDRSAFVDITNDSPIIGLANGRLETPLSSAAKQRNYQCKRTPGSGEALLRGTVKTLLQKVEEEAEFSKLSSEKNRPFLNLKRLLNSPMGLLAPTPANTPQLLSNNETLKDELMGSVLESPIEDQCISQVVREIFDGKSGVEEADSVKSMITRSLLMDFSDKSEMTESVSDCSSVVTYQESREGEESEYSKGKSPVEEDDASIWSIQVNASTQDEDEDELIAEEPTEEEDYYDEEGEELCKGMSKMSVNVGKHIRFVYNSDDEIVEEKEDDCGAVCAGQWSEASVLRLKGLPTPKGKHLRFPVEEKEEGI